MEGVSEPRRQLATLMSNLPGMVYRCRNDPAYPMEFVSEGSHDLIGYPPAALTGGAVIYGDLIHPEDRDHVWKEIQEAIKKGGPFRATYRLRTAGGEVKWVWEQGRGVFDDKDRLVALEGFITDITRQVELQDDLKQRELQQKAILDNIPDIAWLKDRDGRFVAVNRAFENATGRKAGEVVGQADAAVWSPDIAAKHLAEDEMVMTSGRRISIVEPLRRADGSEGWVETIKTPVADSTGRAAGTAGISRDITDRKVMEEALRESEGRYRLFLQNFPGIAFRTDADLKPVFLHGNVEEITGYSTGEILAMAGRGDTCVQPADRERDMRRVSGVPSPTPGRDQPTSGSSGRMGRCGGCTSSSSLFPDQGDARQGCRVRSMTSPTGNGPKRISGTLQSFLRRTRVLSCV